jgi:6-phosphogluconolactonase/glucosamine-6-phosphate isomerase/deaminase
MESSLKVLPDVNALVNYAQTLICDACQAAIAERGQFTIALAGGSTPKPLYEKLSAQDLPWDKIHVFWGDERYVSPDHPDSNGLLSLPKIYIRCPPRLQTPQMLPNSTKPICVNFLEPRKFRPSI